VDNVVFKALCGLIVLLSLNCCTFFDRDKNEDGSISTLGSRLSSNVKSSQTVPGYELLSLREKKVNQFIVVFQSEAYLGFQKGQSPSLASPLLPYPPFYYSGPSSFINTEATLKIMIIDGFP